MRGISCKQFSLHRAPHAGVFEAAFFLDAHEESLGPARDAPLHRVLIHLGPRGVESGFHLHFVLGLACEAFIQHFVDLVLPSRPDVVVERVEICGLCTKTRRELCRCGRPVRCITAPMSCHGGAVAGRAVLLHDEIHANLRCLLRDVAVSQEPVVFRRCHFHSGRHEMRLPYTTVQCGTSSNHDAFHEFVTLESDHAWFQASLSGDFRMHSAILCAEPALAESEHLFVREDNLVQSQRLYLLSNPRLPSATVLHFSVLQRLYVWKPPI